MVAKFFALGTGLSWYVVEAQKQENGDVLFFGYVDTGDYNSEWGYFSLYELEQLQYGAIPRVVRDLYFSRKKFSDIHLAAVRSKTD
ncbi:DUF2958 domain-containing protein [Alicyclobacillus fodiniaquatilis]|uniref:DUF2958 domain-containing protein n=1 Tax=Alicyclobacillus fodiniaquatilis TaxID=1661150 RepID=A0ABW4JK07_9BACL